MQRGRCFLREPWVHLSSALEPQSCPEPVSGLAGSTIDNNMRRLWESGNTRWGGGSKGRGGERDPQAFSSKRNSACPWWSLGALQPFPLFLSFPFIWLRCQQCGSSQPFIGTLQWDEVLPSPCYLILKKIKALNVNLILSLQEAKMQATPRGGVPPPLHTESSQWFCEGHNFAI